MLSFQKLDVYRSAIEFLALSTGLAKNLPKGHAGLAEQLRRAALSIPLNIGEAAGRASEADGARHSAIARGSAMECAAIVDALDVLSVLEDAKRAQASDLLGRIVALLTWTLSTTSNGASRFRSRSCVRDAPFDTRRESEADNWTLPPARAPSRECRVAS
jgi:four helix bundle protein